jgi:rifampicin phosphotransferase
VLEGFDIVNPTIGERPQTVVGRLMRALEVDTDEALQRSATAAASIRSLVPAEHQATFDDLLGEARLVYRLRDERGLYSDISAIGLLRLGLLEFGRRLEHVGRVKEAEDVLDATLDELAALRSDAEAPTAHDLHQRGIDRLNLTLQGAPRFIGDPPPPPPSADGLPPAMARLMSAMGFLIDGILGQMESPGGDESTVVGIPGAQGVYEGAVRIVRSVDDLLDLEPGDVLLAPTTGEAFNSMLHLVGAIVTDHGSFASHAAIVSREMGIPAVVGTIDGTRRLAAAKRVRVDGTNGRVTILE